MIHKVTKVEPISPTINFTKRDANSQNNFSNPNGQKNPDDSNLSFQQVLEEQLRLLEEKKQPTPTIKDDESEGKHLTLTRKVPRPNRNLNNQN